MKLQRTDFLCKRDGLTIRGKHFRPATEEMLPAVIICHGFMSNQQSVWKYARQIAEDGYAVFTFDFCGGCIKGTSDGRTVDMTVLTEVADLNAVIDYVLSRTDILGDGVTLMGCSQGGFVSALTAVQRQKCVEKLILFYPALCIPDDAKDGKMMFARFDPNHIPPVIKCGPMKLGRDYAASMLSVDPFEAIRGYHGQVFIVHGTDDEIVKLSYAERAVQAYGKADCHLLVLQGAGHGFKGNADHVAIGTVREYLAGRKEVLTIDVSLKERRLEWKGLYTRLLLPFCGKANSKWFCGDIQPGAVDVQDRKGWKVVQFRAEYTIEGKDWTGTPCKLHIVNLNTGQGWKPTISTDSEALSFLNQADCRVYLQHRKSGPMVHIFASVPKK